MSNINDGGPAFPGGGDDWTAPGPDGGVRSKSAYRWNPSTGMSLRDYFAAKAMAALIGRPDFMEKIVRPTGVGEEKAAAHYAYAQADAMIEARKERNNE